MAMQPESSKKKIENLMHKSRKSALKKDQGLDISSSAPQRHSSTRHLPCADADALQKRLCPVSITVTRPSFRAGSLRALISTSRGRARHYSRSRAVVPWNPWSLLWPTAGFRPVADAPKTPATEQGVLPGSLTWLCFPPPLGARPLPPPPQKRAKPTRGLPFYDELKGGPSLGPPIH